MRRSGLFSAFAVLALLLPAGVGQQPVKREGEYWTRTVNGTLAGAPRLRVHGHGPVTLEGGVSSNIAYSVKLSVKARTQMEAEFILKRHSVRAEMQGDGAVLSAPGGAVMSYVIVRAARLSAASISTSDGAVNATGIEGSLEVDSGAGELAADRIGGYCKLLTGGGDLHVGRVDGALNCTTGAGRITVKSVGGDAVLETNGGDIAVTDAGGQVRAETGGGGVRIANAGGPVAVTTGGGEVFIGKAAGIVTARNMAGPVQVGAAAGVQCQGTGGIQLSNIAGSMRVFTSMGSIMASLLGSRLSESVLATGNGDITVLIPSNVGVTIRAESEMADTLRRIVSDFPAVRPHRQGTLIVAEGAINGGGPLLRISDTAGTIFIKRQ
jgi:DUF4097 and DUF4098 domain-containing protein YvlB